MVLVLGLFLSLGINADAATKYDVIINDPGLVKMLNKIETRMEGTGTDDYLNLIISEDDLNKVIQSGKITKEQRKFISENKTRFLSYLKFVVLKAYIIPLDPAPGDDQVMYIVGVIQSHKNGKSAVKAKTTDEAQMEKMFFREHPLYQTWEMFQKPGKIEWFVKEQLNLFDKAIAMDKKKK